MKWFSVAATVLASVVNASPLLPETIATVDDVKIPSRKIQKAWDAVLRELPSNAPPETASRIFQDLAEKCVWQHEISRMLAEKGIKADRRTAEKYFKAQQKKHPEELAAGAPDAVEKMLDSKQMQLKAAIYFYLDATVPEKIRVSPYEVEQIYRSMPEKFRFKGRETWGILTFKEREKAEFARALLLQGSAFDVVAKEYSSNDICRKLPENLPEMVRKMKVKEISPVIKMSGLWLVVKLRKREKGGILPLEKVRFAIQTELESARESAALAEILKKRLAGKKIVYSKLIQ